MSSLEEQRQDFMRLIDESRRKMSHSERQALYTRMIEHPSGMGKHLDGKPYSNFFTPGEAKKLERIESALFTAYKNIVPEATFRGCPTIVDGSLVGVDADGFAMILGPGMWDAVYRKDSDE